MTFSDFKISTKLSVLAGFLLLMMTLLGLFSWMSLNNAHNDADLILSRSNTIEHAIDTARKAQVDFKIQVQEWKNILLRGNNTEAFEKHKKAFLEQSKATSEGLKSLTPLLEKLKLSTPLVDEAHSAHKELETKYLEALKQYDSANAESPKIVDGLVKGMDRAPTKKIDDIVEFVLTQSNEIIKATEKEQAASAKKTILILSIVILLALLVGISFTYFCVINIVRPIEIAVKLARTVADGDLSSRIEVKSIDETGQLMQALKEMNDGLIVIVKELHSGTDLIASASKQIAMGNLDLSSRTEEQAGSIEETVATMEELTSTVRQNADNTDQANKMANDTSRIATQGGAVVTNVINNMESINQSSKKIMDIIGVIDGIAFQTNILALNAAVEAARAGEQGRGFAVVASEVRNLAQRSASAAKEIKELIGDSVEKVEMGSKLVHEAGSTMTEILSSVQSLTLIISEIASANREQSTGIDHITQAITQMDNTTQQNAALVEEAAAAAASMENQADRLNEVANRFKLGAHPSQRYTSLN
jgi:methyl-accepting chemotaxis protein-1 (serine sensor receptor)